MLLSKRTQYGLRAMICLADAYEHGYLQAKELAAREKLPAKFLESIMSALTRGRFLTSRIGATGGYRLARAPKDIFVGDIVARLEGRGLKEEGAASSNERPGEMAVRLMQARLVASIRHVLNSTSLAQLADMVSQESGGQMYYI